MRVAWLVALAGCRQIYGLDDPALQQDAFVNYGQGLDEHILIIDSFWTQRQDPDVAWQATRSPDAGIASKTVWHGTGPTVAELMSYDVNTTSPFSVWFDGQILIRDDNTVLQLTADDYAFVDFDLDGSYSFGLDSKSTVASTLAITGRMNQWLQVRIGWSQVSGAEQFLFQRKGVDDQTFSAFTDAELREPVAP